MVNALTIDVEDYYQVSAFESVVRFEEWDRYESRIERNTRRILNILSISNVTATFFVLGWVAERYPHLVKEIHASGHEIACHGYLHRRISRMAPGEFRIDLRRAKKKIEDLIGEAVLGHRAASFSITKENLWSLEILWEEGFQYDSSIFPIRHDRYGIPDFHRFPQRVSVNGNGGILEVPPSTIRVAGINVPIAGGGYLRLLPYPVVRWGIRRINEREQQPAIIYLHPWELDPDQPRIQARWISRVRHYTNLDQMEARLRSLLSSFSFAPIREVYAACLDRKSA